MPASKDTCPACSAAFFGRQKFLKCAGPCGFRYHLDCINLGDAEYDLYMERGNSSYNCERCISASKTSRGDETPVGSKKLVSPVKKVISPTRELKLPSLPSVDSLSVQVETVRLNSVTILDTLSDILDYVKSLHNEMLEIKNENAALKIQMAEILDKRICSTNSDQSNPKVVQQVNASCIRKSYSQVLSQSAPASSKQSNPGTAKSASASNVVTTQLTANEVGSPSPPIDGEGFQVVAKKRKVRKVTQGVLTSSALETVPVRAKMKSLFVSRFSPKVNGKSIEDSLKNQLTLSSLVVTKLKTKYETYSSFHISVEEKDFHLINNTGVWPVGCLIAPFYGKLKPEQHYASTAREPEGSNGNAS